MNTVKASLLLSLSLLVSSAIFAYIYEKDSRFSHHVNREGLYIFDNQTMTVNFCNQKKCIVMLPHFDKNGQHHKLLKQKIFQHPQKVITKTP